MQEERLEILKMVSEGTVTVDQAASLMDALEKGGASKSRERMAGRSGRDGLKSEIRRLKRMARKTMEETLEGVRDGIGDIGSTARSVVAVALGAAGSIDPAAKGYERVELEDDTFELLPTDRLTTGPDRNFTGGAAIEVRPADGSLACVTANEKLSVWRRDGSVLVCWQGGELKLELPRLSELVLKTPGGDITGEVPAVESLTAKTLGGNVMLANVYTPFCIKTMGGNIDLGAVNAQEKEGVAKTMGGNIALALDPSCSVSIRATTMGGSVDVAREFDAVDRQEGIARDKATVIVGDGVAKITAQTLGGSITIGSAQ